MLKQTSIHALHVQAGAKMMPFAGYDMPLRYAGDTAEHLAVRQQAGLFDVSHMGEFLIKGPQALPLLQRLTSNDVSKVPVGKAQYNALMNPQGGIVDDLIVYRLEDELYMVVVNASNIQKDWDWFTSHNTQQAVLQDISDDTALLALSGPMAPTILQQLTTESLEEIPYYAHRRGVVAGLPNVLIATTGYTGERTFELYLRSDQAPALWASLLQAGIPHGLQPTGLAARDTLRLEMGYMLYGNDIDDTTSPLEAGLGWITRLDKPSFTAQQVLQQQKEAGLQRKLVGFTIAERGAVPRSHYPLLAGGEQVGQVTSGTFSPSLQLGIGMGYVPIQHSQPGTTLQVLLRGRSVAATVVKPPFVQGTSLARWMGKK